MSKGTVLVTGATGTVGRVVVEELVGRGETVRGATRDPERARRSGAPATEWVAFDFERPAGFDAALRGVDRLFLIARPGDDDPARVAGPLVEAMARAGVRRVVSLTALGVDRREDISLRRVETMAEDAGFACTHVRPNWFMQVFSGGPLLAGLRAVGRIRVPAGDARISYVDARDVGGVSAAALAEGGHEGKAYALTGPKSLDHREVARMLSEASGREITYVPQDEDEARTAIMRAGLGAERAERLIGFYRLVRAGHSAPVTGDVEAVLGRPAIPFSRFAEDHAHHWRVA